MQQDAELGPIFATHVGVGPEAWAPHLDRMTSFWCSVMLQRGTYDGNPMVKHRGVPELRVEHFGRWLELFEATAAEVFDPAPAAQVVQRARAMGAHLSRHLCPPL